MTETGWHAGCPTILHATKFKATMKPRARDPEPISTDAELAPEPDPPVEAIPDGEPAISPSTDAGAEQEIMALAKEVAVQKDKYLRLYADFENSRKRAVRERQEAESKGMGFLVKGILDCLDDLGRFAHLDPASTDTKTVVEGVELVERKLLKSLAGHGLELINPVDAPFDPAFHEAITTTPAASKDEDHFVALVYQVGYLFNGTLLRPARVVVKQWSGAADGHAN